MPRTRTKKGTHPEDMQPVPLPSSETEEERRRIRASNNRDQQLEREGKRSAHNEGYDEAADGERPSTDVKDLEE